MVLYKKSKCFLEQIRKNIKHYKRQYQAKAGILESLKIDGITKTLGNQNAMTKEEWEAVKTEQVASYYKSIHSFNVLANLTEEHAKDKKTRGLN